MYNQYGKKVKNLFLFIIISAQPSSHNNTRSAWAGK
jgi:hypothetical protein